MQGVAVAACYTGVARAVGWTIATRLTVWKDAVVHAASTLDHCLLSLSLYNFGNFALQLSERA